MFILNRINMIMSKKKQIAESSVITSPSNLGRGLIITGGQSNQSGSFPDQNVEEPMFSSDYSNIQYVAFVKKESVEEFFQINTFENMNFQSPNQPCGTPYGVEYACSENLVGDYDYIKVSQGGTSLNIAWRANSVLRNALINKIKYCLAVRGGNYNKIIFYWDQWESDASSGLDYEQTFIDFFEDVKLQSGLSGEDVELVLMKASVNSSFWNADLQTAQDNIIAHYNGTYLDADDLDLSGGQNLHYTAAHQTIRGERLATIIKNNLI